MAGPPPVVSLAGRQCEFAPDLAKAQPVVFNPERPLTVKMDAEAACLQAEDGSRSTYAAFRLPEATEPYILSVTSTPQGQGLLSPRLVLLDDKGVRTRERVGESPTFQGAALYAGVRARPEERYLIVLSDPRLAGQSVSHIVTSRQATVVPVGTGFVAVHSGSEGSRVLTYAHNGDLTVTVKPVPTIN
jgi:hypothetical protein